MITRGNLILMVLVLFVCVGVIGVSVVILYSDSDLDTWVKMNKELDHSQQITTGIVINVDANAYFFDVDFNDGRYISFDDLAYVPVLDFNKTYTFFWHREVATFGAGGCCRYVTCLDFVEDDGGRRIEDFVYWTKIKKFG